MRIFIDTEAGTISRSHAAFGYARGGYVMNLSHLFMIAERSATPVRLPEFGVSVKGSSRCACALVGGKMLRERRITRSFTLEAI